MIELMVAAAITALIAGALVTVASNAALIWKRGTSVLSVDNRANFILNQLETDLSSIIWYPGNPGNRQRAFFAEIRDFNPPSWTMVDSNRHWGGVTTNATYMRPSGSSSLDLNDPDLTARRYGRAGLHLGFLARTQDGNTPGVLDMYDFSPRNVPTFIAYQIVRQEESWGVMKNVRYRLYRSVVRPGYSSDTSKVSFYQIGTDIRAATNPDDYRFVPGTLPNAMNDDPFHPASIEIPHPNMVLAEGVVDFGMVAYDEDGIEIPYNATPEIASGDIADIRSVVIFIRLLTDEGAQLLSQYEVNGGEDDWWDDVVIPNSKVYTRRIPIRVGTY